MSCHPMRRCSPAPSGAGFLCGLLKTVLVFSPVLLLLAQCIAAGGWQNAASIHPAGSDECAYWRELYSLSKCGLSFGSGGIFTGCEALVGPFEVHGLAPLAAWGWYAMLFPWQGNSIVIADLMMLMLAYLLLLALTKPNLTQTALVLLAAVSYPPLLLFLPSSMMEIPCYAGIIVCIALLIRYEHNAHPALFAAVVLCVTYCSLMRVCYIVLLLPAILKRCGNRPGKKLAVGLALYMLGFFVLRKFANLFCAQYPFSTLSALSSLPMSAKISLVRENFMNNLTNFFSASQGIVQTSQHYFYVFLLILLLFLVISAGKNRASVEKPLSADLGFLLAGGGLAMMVLLLYDVFDWRDYRTLAPMAFGILIWIVLYPRSGGRHRCAAAAAAAATVMLAAVCLCQIPSWAGIRAEKLATTDNETWPAWAVSAEQKPETLAVRGVAVDYSLIALVPPQIGIQSVFDDAALHSLHTDYLLTDTADGVPQNYRYLGVLPGRGLLYQKETE